MTSRRSLTLVAALSLVGCAADDPTVPVDPIDPTPDAPPSPPAMSSVRIVFPPGPSATDATWLHVRGTGVGLAAVTVNGVAATSTDGFATWIAEVALVAGDNVIAVATRDVRGATHDAAATTRVVSRPLELRPAIASKLVATPGGRILDTSGRDVHAVDAVTGRRTVLARGALDALGGGLALDAAGAHLYALRTDGVLDLELATGLATVIATSTGGARGLVLDEPRGRLLAATSGGLVAIDLATGGLTTLLTAEAFDVAVHGGRAFVLADEATAAGPRGAVFVVDLASSATSRIELGIPPCCSEARWNALAVEPATGTVFVARHDELSIVSPGPVRRFGPGNSSVGRAPYGGLAFDAGGRMLATLEAPSGAVTFVVDRTTGELRPLEDDQLGAGIALLEPVSIGALADGRLGMWDRDTVRIEADLTRARVAERHFVTGDNVRIVDGLALQDESNAILNDVRLGLTALDVATGEVVMTSSETIGSGPTFGPLRVIATGSLAGEVFALDEAALYGIELATGRRRIVSGRGVGGGVELPPAIDLPFHNGAALDAPRGRVLLSLYTDTCNLLAIDLASGDRSCVTTHDPRAHLIINVVAGDRLYGASHPPDAADTQILAMDTAGAFTLVSGPERGTGPTLGAWRQIEWDLTADAAGLLVAIPHRREAPLYIDPVSGDRVQRVR